MLLLNEYIIFSLYVKSFLNKKAYHNSSLLTLNSSLPAIIQIVGYPQSIIPFTDDKVLHLFK
jgi:PII-like signaling protein